MMYVMLFRVPEALDYRQLRSELETCCELEWLKLTPDTKKNIGFQFGQFEGMITDRKIFDGLVQKYQMQFKVQPSSRPAGSGKSAPKQRQKNTIANPSFHFYKSEAYGKGIESYRFDEASTHTFALPGTRTFSLMTRYPGLLVGAGYLHPKLRSSTDDFQLGFFFDHTTGLPLINGSSIKGVIRSRFPEKGDRYYDQKIAYLKERYGVDYSQELVSRLFEERQVIFYDAYISRADGKGRIFGSDYITSHYSDELSGVFKEPNPIRFLKILPEVTFTFQFRATDDDVKLFQKILVDFGVGAKTNVGYGQFEVIGDVHADAR